MKMDQSKEAERKPKMTGPRTPINIFLHDEAKKQLTKFTNSYTTAHSTVIRSLIILLISVGFSISEVSRQTKTSRLTVRKWAYRYNESGIKGLEDEPRTGRPQIFNSEIIMHIIKIACEMPDKRGRSLAMWDCQEIAVELMRTKVVDSISSESVRRILESQKLKPWKNHMWLSEKKPRDQAFCDSVREIIDIYFKKLKRSECVLCMDENTSIQARKRIAEPERAKPNKSVLVEHEYERKGALNLFAAFDTRTGKVYGRCYDRKRQIECIDFCEYLNREIPKNITTIHIVCDNVSTHHGKEMKKWLKANPRFIFHYTPVHCSWMNQIEQWFGILKRKRLLITHFQSKADLRDKLYLFIDQWNEHAHAFKWNEKTRSKLNLIVIKIEERLALNNDIYNIAA
jgi:transposase